MKRLVLLALLAALGCGHPRAATEVIVILDAQPGVRDKASRYAVWVEGGPAYGELSESLESEVKASALPAKLALAPRDGDASRVYAVELVAFAADALPVARARLRGGYVAGELRSHHLLLEDSCLDQTPCADDETCSGGACRDALVAPSDLAMGLPDDVELASSPQQTGQGNLGVGDGPGHVAGRGADGEEGSLRDAGPDAGGEHHDAATAGAASGGQAPAPGEGQSDGAAPDDSCPPGYEGEREPQCTPYLLTLNPPRGALSPAFDRQVTSYTLDLWPEQSRYQLQLAASEGAEIVLDQRVVAQDVLFESASVAPGPFDETISLVVRSGDRPTRTYTLHVRRAVTTIAQAAPGLGFSLAASGDVIAVGAPFHDSDTGAVRIYQRDAQDNWQELGHIRGTQAGAHFGFSVALEDETLVVGAPEEVDAEGSATGAVHVFARGANGWRGQASERQLRPRGSDAGDRFGCAVALSGDTIAVGANGEASAATSVGGDATNNDAPGSGAVYIFDRRAGAFEQVAYLKAENAAADADFGAVVSMSGDLVAVGAQYESSRASRSGAVYIFARSGGAFSQEARLKAPNAEANDRFGRSVSLLAERVMVGAPEEDGGGTGVNPVLGDNSRFSSGAGYIFERDPALKQWTHRAYLKGDELGEVRAAGVSVALGPDVAVLGAPLHKLDSVDLTRPSGAVFLFKLTDQGWLDAGHYSAAGYGLLPDVGENVAVASFGVIVGATDDFASNSGLGGVYALPLP